MHVFIVEDKPDIRTYLLQILQQQIPEAAVVGTAGSVAEALALIPVHNPDLLLLDVELPDGKSFDILQQLPGFNGRVIFITAHNEFALQAIKFSAFDYLLKPVDEEELQTAVRRALQEYRSQQALADQLSVLKEHLEPATAKGEGLEQQKIVLADSDNVYLIRVGEIIRCASEGNYTTFHLSDGREILASKPIKTFEQMLSGRYFFRVHRSHLVNLNYFKRFEKKDGGTIHLSDGSTLPVAVRRRERLMDALQAL